MRIAFIHPPFETMPTLTERSATASLMVWTHETAKRLVAEGHTVAVFSRGDGTHSGVMPDQGISFRYIPPSSLERRFVNGLTNLTYFVGYLRPKRPVFATRWFYPLYIDQVARQLGREQWDIIHITNMPPFAPALRAHNPSTRIILHAQALWLSQFDPALVRRYLQASDYVLTVSDFLTAAFTARFPDYADRCQTLYNGVDIDRFLSAQAERTPTPTDAPHILFVGRVSPEKGVHVLIEAFKQVAARHPRAELHIVGGTNAIGYDYLIPMDDDPIVRGLRRFYHPLTKRDRYLPALKALIPPELAAQVHFHGSVPHAQLKQYFGEASVFAFPSAWSEPFGIALVEGLASGVPVVTTRSGGVVELAQDGVNCLMVARDNPDEMACAILRLCDDPALGQQLSHAAQEHVKGLLSWDHAVAELRRVYDRLLSPATK